MASEVAGAEIVTLVSTGATTVIRTLPVTVTPPAVAVAVIVADPPATPVTRPLPLTVAVPDADELHVTVAAIAAPNWSFALAASCVVAFVAMVVAGAVIVTVVSTGAAVTVTEAVPVTTVVPEVAVAEIVAEPADWPVTRPDALTDAIVGADDAQVIVAEKALPLWSCGVAVSCSVWPATTDCAGDVTPTEVSTGGGGAVSPPPEQPAKASARARIRSTERAEIVDS
jgi:hypothetical protein